MLSQIASQLQPLAGTIAPLAGEATEALQALSQMGYRAVQLSATQVGTRPRDLDVSGRKDLMVQLRKLGLACAGLDLWIPSSHFVDSAFIDRAVNAVTQSIMLAASLGRCSVSIALPEQTDQNKDQLRDVREAIQTAAQHEGIWIADHGLDAATGKWSCEASSFLGIGIDPPMLMAAGHDVSALVARFGASIVSARIVDLLRSGMRGPPDEPGNSRLDFQTYAATLASLPLRTSPVADARQWTDAHAGLRATIERWTGDVTQ